MSMCRPNHEAIFLFKIDNVLPLSFTGKQARQNQNKTVSEIQIHSNKHTCVDC